MYHIDIDDKNKHCSRGDNGFKLTIALVLLVVKIYKEVIIS